MWALGSGMDVTGDRPSSGDALMTSIVTRTVGGVMFPLWFQWSLILQTQNV